MCLFIDMLGVRCGLEEGGPVLEHIESSSH